MEEYGMYIDGKWVPSVEGGVFETKNPTNGEVLATFPAGTKEDVLRAIDAAEKAFPAWKKVPPPRRGRNSFESGSNNASEERRAWHAYFKRDGESPF